MKVAIVADFVEPYAIGGAEVVSQSLAEGLARRGLDVVLVTTGPSRTLRRSRPLPNLTLYRFLPTNVFFHFPPGIRRSVLVRVLWWVINLWNPFVYRTVRAILRAERPDVVSVQNFHTLSPSVFTASVSSGCRVFFTAHDHVLLCFHSVMARRDRLCRGRCIGCRIWSGWQVLFLRHVRLLFTSAFSRDLHRAFLGLEGEVVANPVVPPEVVIRKNEARRRPGKAGPISFLYIGRLTRVKGVGTLLAAFSLVRSAQARLNIVGAGELEREVVSLAKRDPRLAFRGRVSDKEKDEILADGDVLVFPSECHEASPVTLVEAYSHGVPIIGTDLGSLSEHIEEGRTGWLVPPGDAAGLARVMDRLCGDPGEIARARVAAFVRARDLARQDILGRLIALFFPRRQGAPSRQRRGG